MESQENLDPLGNNPTTHENILYQIFNRSAGFPGRFNGVVPSKGAHTPQGFLPAVYRNRSLVSKLALYKELKHHRGCVNAVSWSSCGRWIVSGSDDTVCCIWDWHDDGKLALRFDTGHRANIFSSQFMPSCNNTRVITCARDHQVRAFNVDMASRKMLNISHVFTQHKGSVKRLANFPDDPNAFLSCSEDGTVRLFDLRESAARTGKTVVDMPIDLSTISLSGNYFSIAGSSPYVYVFDARRIGGSAIDCLMKFGPQHITLHPNNLYLDSHITGVAMRGSEILASYSADNVYLFDMNKTTPDGTEADPSDKKFEKEYSGHCNIRTVKSVSFFGPQGEYVLSGSDCGRVFIWEKESTKLVNMMKGDEYVSIQPSLGLTLPREVVNVLSGHPFDPVLATVGIDYTVKMWTPHAEAPTDLSKFDAVQRHNQARIRRGLGGIQRIFLSQRMAHFGANLEFGFYGSSDDNEDEDDAPLECRPQ